mgnify:CR=1 FL=1
MRRSLFSSFAESTPKAVRGQGVAKEESAQLVPVTQLRLLCIAQAAAAQKALETENSKLKYQVLHLKRAVAEGDEKLAAVGKDGKQ